MVDLQYGSLLDSLVPLMDHAVYISVGAEDWVEYTPGEATVSSLNL